ncbi:SLATT domain-containing protein [bacterium SCSIO 12696]|nr:SLATT domain-containing protein [bacterium SCSIO 12696]
MKKEDFLMCVAEIGYNVGFGAKKHFATLDIVEKAPGIISFLSMAFGIYALAIDDLSTRLISATFIVLGIVGLYISMYNPGKVEYKDAANELTQLYNKLSIIYRKAKAADEDSIKVLEEELFNIQNEYYKISQTKQILFSDWYAHYKFFWQHQIAWVDEQKKFKLLRDKVPLTFSLFIFGSIIALVIGWFDLGIWLAEVLCKTFSG